MMVILITVQSSQRFTHFRSCTLLGGQGFLTSLTLSVAFPSLIRSICRPMLPGRQSHGFG